MNPTLQSLQALGVRELSVKNQKATAVNPWEEFVNAKDYFKWIDVNALPPLPTSGIPDGTVLIEQVEPIDQYCSENTGEWLWTENIHIYKESHATRQALRLKQVKEEEPMICPDCNGLTGWIHTESNRQYCPECLKFFPILSSVEPEGEQTAEGIEQAKDQFAIKLSGLSWEELVEESARGEVIDLYDNFIKTFAASQLAQYKAKLIAQVTALLFEENERKGNPHYACGFTDAIDKAIKIFQTR